MCRSLGGDAAALLAGTGPVADDARLAAWFQTCIDDDLFYSATASDEARALIEVLSRNGTAAGGAASRAGAAATTPPKDNVRSVPPISAAETAPPARDRRTVFVVTARASRPARCSTSCAVWTWPRWNGRSVSGRPDAAAIAQGVMTGMAIARAVVVLLTPDDTITSDLPDAQRKRQPDADVLVRLGIAMAGASHRQVVLVRVGDPYLPEYLAGVDVVQLDASPQCRRKLGHRLRLAGCDVNDIGGDWLSVPLDPLLGYARRP